MRERRCDVCIVGGSIAGATLACHLAAEGFSVCVLEKRRRGERKLCAELTHVNLLTRIATISGCACQDAPSAPLDRVEVVAGPFRLGRSFELGKGITLDRPALEGALLDHAASLGAEVLQPVQAREVAINDAVAVVTAEGEEILAEVVVGADGASSLIGRRLSRPWRRDEIGATRHLRLPVEPALLSGGETTVRFELLGDIAGYGWLVPYREEIGVGVGSSQGAIDVHLGRLLAAHGQDLGVDLESLSRGEVRGAPVPAAGPKRPTSGDRFLLIGDAGGFVSPASGEGMSLAVTSAEAAASTLKLCFATGRFGANRLRHYERMWRRAMPDFDALRRLRDAMAGPLAVEWLEACDTDLERLVLLAPLVGSPDRGVQAEQLLERLRAKKT